MRIAQHWGWPRLWDYERVIKAPSLTAEMIEQGIPDTEKNVKFAWLRNLLLEVLKIELPSFILAMSFVWHRDDLTGPFMIDLSDPTFILIRTTDNEDGLVISTLTWKTLEENPTVEFLMDHLNCAIENIKEMEPLCDQFEKNILYDAHQLETRVHRSSAGKEISAKGQAIFAWIADKIYKAQKRGDDEVALAWVILLCTIAQDLKLERIPKEVFGDFAHWIEWGRYRALI